MTRMRRHHDMGGLAAGPVDRTDHDPEPWEMRVDAIMRLLTDKKRQIMTVDELRRGIEDLGPGAYDELNYYERWIASITNILIEKGVITVDELGRRMSAVEARWTAERKDVGR
ncbi:MAG: nitrile hydratase subunit beta [Rhodospirillales bacterium]|nr:nitrile hydratase subunit beta [Rhodospirillales bacterium]